MTENNEAEIIDLRSVEDRIAANYKELGVKIKTLQDERDAIKNTDIWPAIEAGIAFHYGNEILVPEYISTTDFDWKRAVKEGAISQEVLKEYSTPKVEARLFFRKAEPTDDKVYEAYLRDVHDRYKRFQEEKKDAREKAQSEVIR